MKNSGNALNLAAERGDHIVPNFEEIWPSGKGKRREAEAVDPTKQNKPKGMNYVLSAMAEGLPGNRDGIFTTVGKPKVGVAVYCKHGQKDMYYILV